MEKYILLIACLIPLLNFTSCTNIIDQNSSATTAKASESKGNNIAINTTIQENREGELVFSCSAQAFIDNYNCIYKREKESSYLTDLNTWQHSELTFAIHSKYPTNFYNFSADRSIWSMPTMSLYTQTNSDMIQEVCLNYDEHSYSEATYALYEEMCYYTLKVFLPELSEDEIISLYKEVNEIGEKHIFPHENGYTNQSIPYAILYKDSVGIYPYFAVGESLHLCIIPINDEVLEYYGSLGSQIKEIPPRG